jgi:hypothetical protein
MPWLTYFPDGGVINYRQPETRFFAIVKCVPNAGAFHNIGVDVNRDDLMIRNPSDGHVTVCVRGVPLIQNAEGGYRSGANLGNALLIDGKGQYGDCAYPMSVPMRRWRGQRIEFCRVNPDGRSGSARVNLGPAYPDEAGVLRYTRDIEFEPDRLRIRDTVVCGEPHSFGYHFNTFERHELERLDDRRYRIAGDGAALVLEFGGDPVKAEVRPTEVVRSYCNKNEMQDFKHIEIASVEARNTLAVEFTVTPDADA